MHKINDCFEDPLLDDMVSREILVDNRGNSSELEDYQVDLAIDEKQLFFQAQDDLRFVDENLKIINHWNESFPDVEWLKVTKVPGNGVCALRMLDGGLSLGSASNGDNTFTFFDDFSSDPGCTGNCGPYSNGHGENAEVLYSSANDNIYFLFARIGETLDCDYDIVDTSEPFMEFDIEIESEDVSTKYGASGYIQLSDGTKFISAILTFDSDAGSNTVIRARAYDGISYAMTSTLRLLTLNTTYHIKVYINSNNLYLDIDNGATVDSVSVASLNMSTTFTEITHYNPGSNDWYNFTQGWYDDIRGRKYTSPEPTAEIGMMI